MSLGSKRSFGLIDPVCRHRAVFRLADLLTAEVLIADRAACSPPDLPVSKTQLRQAEISAHRTDSTPRRDEDGSFLVTKDEAKHLAPCLYRV